MNKYIANGVAELIPEQLSVARMADWPWRKILAEGGILLAFLLTSSFLLRS